MKGVDGKLQVLLILYFDLEVAEVELAHDLVDDAQALGVGQHRVVLAGYVQILQANTRKTRDITCTLYN